MSGAAFEFATAGRIVFGSGAARQLPVLAAPLGRSALVLTGSRPERYEAILRPMEETGRIRAWRSVGGEPTTSGVQALAAEARDAGVDHVIAIGGGSVIDAGKAVAAMLTNPGDLLDYLEVVGGGRSLAHRPVPLVAVSTTAGAGAEVTRNAVLKVPDKHVKVSMRHTWLLPTVALVDPELTASMPPEVTAATGLDALTQLLEAFVGRKANPLTDGFCREGLSRAARSLERAWADGGDLTARTDMSLAALLGGMALANAGLGAVHGFAGPLGGIIEAPHGVICARLLPHVVAANVAALRQRGPAAAIERFNELARLLTGCEEARAQDAVAWIRSLCDRLQVPALRSFGLRPELIAEAVAKAQKASSMKGNPVELTDSELTAIVQAAL